MIAGRLPETPTIVIYDPVREAWRSGPSLTRRRGGFAAAVVGDQIVVGGGELISSPPGAIVPTVEVYTAGGDGWRFAPSLPLAVHGVAAGAALGRFYVFSGATVPGSTGGTFGRTFYIELTP
jgi:hypothetical protein